jgi:hypothetical protein
MAGWYHHSSTMFTGVGVRRHVRLADIVYVVAQRDRS